MNQCVHLSTSFLFDTHPYTACGHGAVSLERSATNSGMSAVHTGAFPVHMQYAHIYAQVMTYEPWGPVKFLWYLIRSKVLKCTSTMACSFFCTFVFTIDKKHQFIVV